MAAQTHTGRNGSMHDFLCKISPGMTPITEIRRFRSKALVAAGKFMRNNRGIDSCMTDFAAHLHRCMDYLSLGEILVAVQAIHLLSRCGDGGPYENGSTEHNPAHLCS